MLRNAWEWVKDCWQDSYDGAPEDGSAWEDGECARRVVRVGWLSRPMYLRPGLRFRDIPNDADGTLGFRVARAL